MSLRDTIINSKPVRKVSEVDMSNEWGCKVYVRNLTGSERLSYAQYHSEQIGTAEGSLNSVIKLMVIGCCDANGEPVFTDDDLPLLKDKLVEDLDKVATAVATFNGMVSGAVDEAEKN